MKLHDVITVSNLCLHDSNILTTGSVPLKVIEVTKGRGIDFARIRDENSSRERFEN